MRGRSYACGTGALHVVNRVRGTVDIVRFGLRTRVVEHHPSFRVSSHVLLRHVSFRHGAVAVPGKGRCRLGSDFLPAMSPTSPCGLASRRQRVVGGLRHSFIDDRGLGGRVHYLFHCKYVCAIDGSGLLFRTSVPLGTSNALGSISVTKGACGKGTLLRGMKRLVHATFFTRRSGRSEPFTMSCM